MIFSITFSKANGASRVDFISKDNLGFAAPIVNDLTNFSSEPAGTIVYDTDKMQFHGMDTNGNWIPMTSVSGNNSVISNAAERIERASINNNGSASITSQSGSWISSVNRSSSGTIDITIANGMFSATPTCVCSQEGIAGYYCTSNPSSATSVTTFTTSGAGATDRPIQIICMGPQ